MKRNIVLIHLESLNVMNYYINYEYFPTLHHINQESVNFSRFYASATSTLMVMSDLAYQGAYVNESFRTMGWLRRKKNKEKSLFDTFLEDGYCVMVQDYPANGVDAQAMNDNKFLGEKVSLIEIDDLNTYHEHMLHIMDGNQPFVLWLCNFMSHIDFNKRVDPDECGINRWMKGYEHLDDEIHYVLEELGKRGLLRTTSIVFYGDHGDDIYSHGYHGGLTHAVEPYAQLIHTPMFIYDERIGKGEVSDVLSTTDIGAIINSLINMPNRPCKLDELKLPNRRYAFSRNMFAAQRVREESFGKGYCVTDGRFLLMVNSKGLSMYETQMDPLCQNNLLDFFSIENGELLANKDVINSLRFHFTYLFDRLSFDTINKKYNELFPALRANVKHIYDCGECINRLYEMDFNVISYSPRVQSVNSQGESKEYNQMCDIFCKYYQGKRVVIYGAGKYGSECYEYIKNKCNIVAWVDQDYINIKSEKGWNVTNPETVRAEKFDIVYIAIEDGKVLQTVYEQLLEWGIDDKKIV